ncbi:MAG: hypoxanthine phosphoribosyltransferase [Streptococcaceae bacterium]|jgi:hypoxanthine phosphoribosyltransferase|nr:hypoxanthine phosphoribosyltransferase [Streptococcaceae bacterium]
MELDKSIEKVLVSETEIQDACKKLGAQLTEDYKDKDPLLLGILRGSAPFMADLIKRIDAHLEIDFMTLSSYHGGTKSSGEVKMIMDIDAPVNGRDILIIEDIIDTGRTLKYVREMLELRGASVKIATLLDKPSGRVVEIKPDYTCFTIPNEFVVGYGLDYDNHYRNLPYVGVLKEEVYTN